MSQPPPSSSPARPVVVVLGTNHDPADRPPGLEPLAAAVELRYVTADELADALPGAEALFCWDFFSTALRNAWPAADALRWVHVAAAGVDSLLFEELVDSRVVVTNARGVFDRPIAEYVLGLLLARAKRFAETVELQASRTWRHRETASIAGMRALVVGTGGIGRETARLLRAAGVQVEGVGRVGRDGDADFGTVYAAADLAAALRSVRPDLVVGVAPLTAATRGLFDAAAFDAMDADTLFVNVGRGDHVDAEALRAGLAAGRPAAAVLDVFSREPLPADDPLWTTPGLTVSPHMAGDVVGWRPTLARQFLANAERWLTWATAEAGSDLGEVLENVVDKRLGYVPSGRGDG